MAGRRRRGIVGAVALALLVATAACSRDRADGPHAALPAPELGGAEEPVAERLASARRDAEELLADPDTPVEALADAFGRLAEESLRYERLASGGVVLESARRLAPEEPRWHLLAGLLARREGRTDAARRALARALDLDADDAVTLVHLGAVELERGARARARRLFDRALASDPESAAAHAGRGEVALAESDPELAVRHLEAALARQPTADVLHPLLAEAWTGRGDEAAAARHRQAARRDAAERLDAGAVLVVDGDDDTTGDGTRPARYPTLHPTLHPTTQLHLVLGHEALATGRVAVAERHLRAAVAREPGNRAAVRGLVRTLVAEGRVDEALAVLAAAEEAARDRGWGAERARLAGDVLVAAGRPAEAIAAFVAGLERDPSRLDLLRRLGDAYLAAGLYGEALQQYATILEADPGDVSARVARIAAWEAAGEPGRARSELDTALRDAPEHPLLLWHAARARAEPDTEPPPMSAGAERELALRLVEEGRQLLRADRPRAAYGRYREALALRGDLVAGRLDLAGLALRLGRFEEAQAAFDVVLSTHPEQAVAWRGKARALLGDGRRAEAKATLREGLYVHPEDRPMLAALARLLAADPDPVVRNPAWGLALAEHLHAARPDAASAATLAMALAASGRFADAVARQREAADAAGPADDERRLAAARLAAYAAGHPWHLQGVDEVARLLEEPP